MCAHKRVRRVWHYGLVFFIVLLRPMTSGADANQVIFGAASNDRCVVLNTTTMFASGRGWLGFQGVSCLLNAEAKPEDIWLSFPADANARVLPLRWRLRGDCIFGLLVRADWRDAMPQPEGLFVQCGFGIRAEYFSRKEMLTIPTREWPADSASSSLSQEQVKEKLNARVSHMESDRPEVSSVLSGGKEFRNLGGILPLDLMRLSLDFGYYDFVVESPTRFKVFILTSGWLERWTLDRQTLPVNPTAPKLSRSRHRWRRDEISFVGVDEPFRIVRAESPVVLVTQTGQLVSDRAHAGEATALRAEVMDKNISALVERDEYSIVATIDQYAVIPLSGQFDWNWRPYKLKQTHSEHESIEDKALLLKRLVNEAARPM